MKARRRRIVLTLLKYSTLDCPACQAAALYDARIAEECGLAFVNVDLRDPAVYRRFRPVLMQQYPLKKEMRVPAYILVDDPEGDFRIYGEISGGPPESMFRSLLEGLLRDLPRDPVQS
jgi:hypothetical protein